MKNIHLLFVIFLFFVTSCSSDEEKETILKLTESELLFSADNDIKYLGITSNKEWSIDQIPDWLDLDKKEGEGNQRIILTSKSNPTEVERTAVLIVTAKDKRTEVRVRQVAKNVTLVISKTELLFSAEPVEEGLSFEIISNEDWSISGIPDWCIFSSTNGSGNAIIDVHIEKNYIDEGRSANVSIKAGSKTESLNIKQNALEIILAFSNEDLTATGTGVNMSFVCDAESKSVMIKSNTKWSVQSSHPDWCKIDKTNGINNELLTVITTDNKMKTDRSAAVTVTAGTKSIKIIIGQGRYIEVDDSNPYQLNERDNTPIHGHRLKKKKVEYIDPGLSGENQVWNFSKLNVLDDNYLVAYDKPPYNNYTNMYILGYDQFKVEDVPMNSLYVCTEHNTMYYFQVKDNILYALGHENPTVILKYDPRMVPEIYPMYYNSYHKSDYKTSGVYSSTVKVESNGYGEIKADGYGSIILPTGTYSNVLRTKFVQTIKDTSAYMNSNPNSKGREYTIYKWYIKGYRYPVLEMYRSINLDSNSEEFAVGFYYPPTDHSYLNKTQTVFLENTPKINKLKAMGRSSFLESILPVIRVKK